MTTELVVCPPLPVVAAHSEAAMVRTVEFLTAGIRNPNTRRAYHGAIKRFCQWCALHGLTLEGITSPHVAAYIEQLSTEVSPPR